MKWLAIAAYLTGCISLGFDAGYAAAFFAMGCFLMLTELVEARS